MRMCTPTHCFKHSLSFCLWCWGVRLVVRTYQLWQLPGQGRWHPRRSVVLDVQCLHQFLDVLQVFCSSFACRTEYISQLNNHARKNHAKNLTNNFCFCSYDDSSKPVPSTNSELVDNRLPTQESKQTSQESASTRERLRSNQAPVTNVDCHGWSQV